MAMEKLSLMIAQHDIIVMESIPYYALKEILAHMGQKHRSHVHMGITKLIPDNWNAKFAMPDFTAPLIKPLTHMLAL